MFRPLKLALIPMAAAACYSSPVYTYPDPLPPPPVPREPVATQPAPQGNTTIYVQGGVAAQPAAVCAATFYDEHPVPYERGGGWCTLTGPHCHDYLPPYTDQYVYRENTYYFGADVNFYYQDYHPVPNEFGGGWCNIQGSHTHRYRPWHDFDYEPTRRVYVYRPTPQGGRVSTQHPTPTYPAGRPYGNDVQARPVAQPTYPTAQPTYPTAQPTYPTAQPTYPTARPTATPTYPTAQPTYPAAQPTYPTAQPTYAQPTAQPTYPTAQPTATPTRAIPYGNDAQAKPVTYPTATPAPTTTYAQPTYAQPTPATPAPTPAHPSPASPTPASNVEVIRFDRPTAQRVEPATPYEGTATITTGRGSVDVTSPAPAPRPSPSSPTPTSPAPTTTFGVVGTAQPVPTGTLVQPRANNPVPLERPYQPPTPTYVQPGSQAANPQPAAFRANEARPVSPVLGTDRYQNAKVEAVNAEATGVQAPGQQKKRNAPTATPTRR